jgi:hypothetical protein
VDPAAVAMTFRVGAAVALNLSKVHPKLKLIARNLPRVAASQGFEVRITSGYRSRATQTKLYKDFLAGASHYPVAPPGTSDHEKGLALDILSTNTNLLVLDLSKVGLYWAGPADPIHFTLVARQPVGGPRLNELESANPIPRASFWESFEKSSKDIVKLASWLPNPLGLASSLSQLFW